MFFDIRTIIGALLSLYGVILLITAGVHSDGRTVNLWCGVVLLVVGLGFIAWTLLRPAKGTATNEPATTEPSE